MLYFMARTNDRYKDRDEINSLQIQLSRTQAGPGRAVKKQQEQNSPNHVQRIDLISVHMMSAVGGGRGGTTNADVVRDVA